MTATDAALASNRWAEVWLDGLAFAFGLAVAWWQGWNTTDLVWSLWLSSLVVGYAIIVWTLTAPLREVVGGLRYHRETVAARPIATVAVTGLVGAGTLFGLVFFTVHFGMFHFVHSLFLNQFFPIALPGHSAVRGFPGPALYAEVLRRYWWFLPAAAIAERAAFRPRPSGVDTTVTPEAVARRASTGDAMTAPYKNVIRMHLLIFFFAIAHFVRLENFAVYTVVYAVYFFPWRLLRPATK